MSETKKKEYKRETCTEAIKDVLIRANDINTNKADYVYPNKIKELIIFGSYANTNKDKIHDVDICLILDKKDNSRKIFTEMYPEIRNKFDDYLEYLFSEYILKIRYLKGKRKMLSIHSNEQEGEEIKDIATSNKHIILIADYKLTKEGTLFLNNS